MAFNPFRGFRKHQKVIFGGLTILCMVTFVMCGSMGRGDFFETVAQMFTSEVAPFIIDAGNSTCMEETLNPPKPSTPLFPPTGVASRARPRRWPRTGAAG